MMRFLKILGLSIAAIIFDLAVYIFLGLMLMEYDDFYEESKGEYFSLESMTIAQQTAYIGIDIWHAVNLLTAAYIIYRVYKKRK